MRTANAYLVHEIRKVVRLTKYINYYSTSFVISNYLGLIYICILCRCEKREITFEIFAVCGTVAI